MNGQELHVVIIGGGIGGLCLAQGLKQAGVSVAVYERDLSATSRMQGYRVHIDPQGSTALHECLPAELWDAFDATGGQFSQGFTLMTERLKNLLAFRDRRDRAPVAAVARHRSISRITLRQILLHGLGDAVHFDKRCVGYEQTAGGGVRALFEDGTTAEGDVLVAADGVNSAVRKQYLPHAEPLDTGVITTGGKIPLTAGVMALAPQAVLDGPALALAPEPCSLFMAIWKREHGGEAQLQRLGIEPDGDDENGYLLLGFGARREFFGVTGREGQVSGAEWKAAMRRIVADWHPNLRKLVELLDESQLGEARVRSSLPVAPWEPTRVTLLGDAIHSMTPYRGIGANIALKDAALLAKKLTVAARGEQTLLVAIGEYESSMREYGFAAAADSLKAMRQFTARKKFGFGLMKTAMRTANAVWVIRRRLAPA